MSESQKITLRWRRSDVWRQMRAAELGADVPKMAQGALSLGALAPETREMLCPRGIYPRILEGLYVGPDGVPVAVEPENPNWRYELLYAELDDDELTSGQAELMLARTAQVLHEAWTAAEEVARKVLAEKRVDAEGWPAWPDGVRTAAELSDEGREFSRECAAERARLVFDKHWGEDD